MPLLSLYKFKKWSKNSKITTIIKMVLKAQYYAILSLIAIISDAINRPAKSVIVTGLAPPCQEAPSAAVSISCNSCGV
ncbi:hypothetical protein P7M41_26180, partial [Vibrio parahaemolyticus]|nr:hypothetical protein [Vibrio parahaemolyticus]